MCILHCLVSETYTQVTLLLVHRPRHWANIKPTLGKYRPIVNLMTGNSGRRFRAGEGDGPAFFASLFNYNITQIKNKWVIELFQSSSLMHIKSPGINNYINLCGLLI